VSLSSDDVTSRDLEVVPVTERPPVRHDERRSAAWVT